MRQGMLHEVGKAQLPLGRNPRLLAFNSLHSVVAGIDLGATNLRIALADLDGNLLAQHHCPTPQDAHLAEQLAVIVQQFQNQTLPGTSLSRVVIGTPGVVSGEKIRFSPNLPALEHPGFIRRLRAAFGCPLEIHNDVNLAALAESQGSSDTVAFISIGTGLGAAVTRNRTIWSGAQGRAGEIGYMPYTSPVGRILEEVLSGVGLAKLYQHFGGEGGAIQALRQDHPAARKACQVLLEALTFACVLLSLTYDPDRIVLGGGVGLQLEPYLGSIKKQIRRQIPFVVGLEISREGDLVAQKGAVLLAVQQAEQELLP